MSLRNPVITLGLGADTLVREEISRLLFEGRTMSYANLKTINELKVLQMSWVFDINFRSTLEILKERNDIGKLAATMPDTPRLQEALDFINDLTECPLFHSMITIEVVLKCQRPRPHHRVG
ncbi:MAG: hypothetical protein NTY00_01320 [Deltaproteobacteria bacterium]|nr:hypothetical protein [Deltaproteobacteria bacterium]